MISKTRAIILRTVRYAEASIIVNAYTEEFGLLGFHVPGVAKGKGAIRPSHLQPLNLVEMVLYYNPVKNLNKIKELKCSPPLHHLHQDIKKRSVAIFMLEVLNKSIREEEKNPNLYQFLHHSIELLEHDNNLHFVPWFLVQLTRYFGCEPDVSSHSEGLVLDLHNGRFVLPDKGNPYLLKREESQLLSHFAQCAYERLDTLNLSQAQRSELIENLLRYCRIHISEQLDVKSIDVLREVMMA